MVNNLLLTTLFLIPFFSLGQSFEPDLKGNYERSEVPFRSVTSLLQEQGKYPGYFDGGENHLTAEFERESQGGKHYLFRQMKSGVRVYEGTYKINTDRRGYIISRFDNLKPFPKSGEHHLQIEDALALVRDELSSSPDSLWGIEVWFPLNKKLVPAVRVRVLDGKGDFYEVLLGNEGNILHRNNLAPRFAGQDSLVNGMVFLPDPLTTAGVPYGGNYTDSNDQDLSVLNDERMSVSFIANYTGSQFTLENPYAKIVEFSAPNTGNTVSTSPNFNYTRSEASFEDVNAFYHITAFQEHVQSLGFSNLANYQIHIDAHGFNGADNSNFNPGYSPPRLTFGEGGVDDAEDADVIIHEYAHALSNSASPGTNNGDERKTLEEGIGDYFAASYSKYLSTNRWQDVFTWDGHNEFWSGRVAATEKCYQSGLDFSNIYEHANLWSSTLMEIWFYLGRDTTDRLMLESMYGFSSNMSMADAAKLFIQADSLLYGGNHYNTINTLFRDRGILGLCHTSVNQNPSNRENWVKLINSMGFAKGEEAGLEFSTKASGTVIVRNIHGMVLYKREFSETRSLTLPALNLKAGTYFLSLRDRKYKHHQTFKLIRIIP